MGDDFLTTYFKIILNDRKSLFPNYTNILLMILSPEHLVHL